MADFPDSLWGGAISIGNFDGVHVGHRQLIQRLLAAAHSVDGPSVVFTFEPHPARLLRPRQAPPPLTWLERKAELLGELGVDVVLACPVTLEWLALGAADFFARVIVSTMRAKAMVEGPNFHFGRGREGDIQRLGQLCEAAEVRLDIVEPVRQQATGEGGGLPDFISSSSIRAALDAGDVAAAAGWLGRPYRLRGIVAHGAGRGATIGFPTANLHDIDTLVPAHGVYAARAEVAGRRWPVAVNIGPNPTFGEHATKVECHLIGFAQDLYGQTLEVDFLRRLRTIRAFGSVDELQSQLREDVLLARDIAAC
ncbi:MAG: bifunctional riboflavin kinase/FAD synthetase [Planctomycetales bacterium]|nr:bifunctional riboflavin kinase/FAD synthetase [Planctomycetales bacterium]